MSYCALSLGLFVSRAYPAGEEFPDGFAPPWDIPYQIDRENALSVLNFSPINNAEEQAKVEAGWHWAYPLPYYFSENGALIVAPWGIHQKHGWEAALSIEEYCGNEYEDE